MDDERRRRVSLVIVLLLCVAIGAIIFGVQQWFDARRDEPVAPPPAGATLATDALEKLPIKGRAPKTGYTREQFGAGWASIAGCDTRNVILRRDLSNVRIGTDGCAVLSGMLDDPYTGKQITFTRGSGTSSAVQIDHVVPLSDAWQKGAQQLDIAERTQFANDPLNVLAVDGPTNQQKSDGDAATWLPPNKDYRCRYIARQIAVKQHYNLWVTHAEHDAMSRVLARCPSQVLPLQISGVTGS